MWFVLREKVDTGNGWRIKVLVETGAYEERIEDPPITCFILLWSGRMGDRVFQIFYGNVSQPTKK